MKGSPDSIQNIVNRAKEKNINLRKFDNESVCAYLIKLACYHRVSINADIVKVQ